MNRDRDGCGEGRSRRPELVRRPAHERAHVGGGRQRGGLDREPDGLCDRVRRHREERAAAEGIGLRLHDLRLGGRGDHEHRSHLDAELDRDRPAVHQREQLPGVHVASFLLAGDDLHVRMPELRARDEHTNTVDGAGSQGTGARRALAGIPVHDVQLIGRSDPHDLGAGAGRQRELSDDGVAIRARKLTHHDQRRLVRIERPGDGGTAHERGQEIEVRVAAVRPIDEFECRPASRTAGRRDTGRSIPTGKSDRHDRHGDDSQNTLKLGHLGAPSGLRDDSLPPATWRRDVAGRSRRQTVAFRPCPGVRSSRQGSGGACQPRVPHGS